MNRKRPKLACRQKVIPRHFTKKRKATLSEILQAAAKGRRIKELLQNNRALAAALEESQSIAAGNAIMLQSYARDSNQILLARKKLKDMASTIEKLVGDLDDVLGCLDASRLTSTTGFCNDGLKMQILAPDLETIEESPRSSLVGNEDELMNEATPEISRNIRVEVAEKSTPVLDTSVTEIYNVANFLTNKTRKQSSAHLVKESDVPSPTIQTPPTPQFSPPIYTSKFTNFTFEKPKDLEQGDCTNHTASEGSSNTHLSKIPVRRPNLFPDPSIPDSPEAVISSVRRETFVVNPLSNKDNNDGLLAFDRRGTFTLQELANELQAKKKADFERRGTFVLPPLPPQKPDLERRGTFVVPPLPPQKPDPNGGSPFQLPQTICTDDKTVLLSEDMDLTEIIPSCALAGVSNKIQSSDFSLCTNKTVGSLKISKQISPIKKHNPALVTNTVGNAHKPKSLKLKGKAVSKRIEEANPESSCPKLTDKISGKSTILNPSGEVTKPPSPLISGTGNMNTESVGYLNSCHESSSQTSKKSTLPISPKTLLIQQKLSDDIIPVEADLDALNEFKKSSRASRKSVLPYHPKESLKQQKLSDDIDLEAIKNCKKSNRASRKSVLPNPPKELPQEDSENNAHNMDDLEEVRGCRRSNRNIRKSVLLGLSKEPSKHNISNNGASDETNLESVNESKRSHRASRKSVLPNSEELRIHQNVLDGTNAPNTTRVENAGEGKDLPRKETVKTSTINSNGEKEVNGDTPDSVFIKDPKEPGFSHDTPILSPEDVSNSIYMKKDFKRASSSSFPDVLTFDSDPEDASPKVARKSFRSRRSFKPHRRGPFIFKNTFKARKSIPKINKLDSVDSKDYDFSSEEDEESAKKPGKSKKPPKKSSKMLKNKNTVAVLERDIGLMYQEQGRRKRSLKRKVSFANMNVTPTNSDCEDKDKNFEILDDLYKANDKCRKANAPVRRSILKKPSLPAHSIDVNPISPDVRSRHKGKLRKISSSASSGEDEQSEKESSYRKVAKSGENETQTNMIEDKSQGDDEKYVKVIDENDEDKHTEFENEFPGDPLSAVTSVDKCNVSNKLSLKEKSNLCKLSNSKSHKNSEFFGFESKRSRSKKTFSGVSERSSRKRVTATDDFLEDVDIAIPVENQMGEASTSVTKSLNIVTTETHVLLMKPTTDEINEDGVAVLEETESEVSASNLASNNIGDDIAQSCGIERTELPRSPSLIILEECKSDPPKVLSPTPALNLKSKKTSSTKTKIKSQSASDPLTEVKVNSRKSKTKNVLKENAKNTPSVTPPPSKARKTSSTGSLKENIVVPDLESGGRSRRNRSAVSFKEPSLRLKMRRE